MTAILRRFFPFCLLLLPLAGCDALSALDEASRPLEVYQLQTPEIARARVSRNVELVVEEPVASGALTTERIMIQPAPLQAQYLPGVRWADTAPVMLQTIFVRSLTETGAFASVGRRPVGSVADFALLSELTDFQAQTTAEGDTATVRVRVVFRLVDESDGRVVATRAFAVTEAARGIDVAPLVEAFDRATSRLTTSAVSWLVASTYVPS
jgi:cholesterol transport system auxiliary component